MELILWGWIEKAKLAEVPGRIVWVVLPVAATAKSALVVAPPTTPDTDDR